MYFNLYLNFVLEQLCTKIWITMYSFPLYDDMLSIWLQRLVSERIQLFGNIVCLNYIICLFYISILQLSSFMEASLSIRHMLLFNMQEAVYMYGYKSWPLFVWQCAIYLIGKVLWLVWLSCVWDIYMRNYIWILQMILHW